MAKTEISFESKADLWMPLDIGRWRRDTAHLSPTEKSAYLALWMYYWENGSLPDDPARLANIAQMSVDTWSITQEALSMHFLRDSSGVLHLIGAREKRGLWLSKRQKAREKAVKAINTRWSKHRAKTGSPGTSSSDTPSIHVVVLENNLKKLSVVQEQKQIQEQPPPTPPARREGLGSPATPAILGVSELDDEPPAAPGDPARRRKSVSKANQGDLAPLGSPQQGNGTHPHLHGSNGRGGTSALGATNIQIMNRDSKNDVRSEAFQKEIFEFWKGQNPEHPDCPWRPAEARALQDLLEHNTQMNLEILRVLLTNRAASLDVNPSALPHKWLRDLPQFSSGPLDRFSKPARSARQL